MSIALRYVDKLGHVNERFLGITHVNNTSAVTLKSAIEEVFNKHSLSISRLRGQGYDGASNMRGVLGISNELSQALQRKDQDIVNAMKLVDISKQRLQVMRDDGWNSLLEEVSAFCEKNNIDVPDMDDFYQPRPRRKAQNMKNSHHYQVELFYTVIGIQLQELNSRFEHSELLLCVACLNPDNLFSTFNKEKLIRLAQFYPSDFSTVQVSFLDNQLETYIHDMRSFEEFSALKGIGQLAEKMVEMKKNVSYPLVYSLVTLALILPVSTATVERAFSAMNIIKNRLRNRIGDQWMNDCLVTYIEKDIFKTIECKEIMQRFQNMKNRRGQLSKIS
ncbi:uncharacterized protein LOC142606298 [Castanea sativa]|uniref:uncharacterized protein LOC142606298 n=1 Tax=Castanea sativa TaxID=21020 RepID=UPI003F652EFB